MIRKQFIFAALSFFFFAFIFSIPVQANNVVLYWNTAALNAIKIAQTPPPIAARALAIVHTSMYDAWAAYDDTALGTRRGGTLRRPHNEHTKANKKKAISYAAFRALVDLFPSQELAFIALLNHLGYDATDNSMDPLTPSGIGNLVAHDLLNFRYFDGSNQLGTEPGSNGTPYSDYTGYLPINTSLLLIDPSRWQPLPLAGGQQTCLAPQWGLVLPFALTSGAEFSLPPPANYSSRKYLYQAKEVVDLSAKLNIKRKCIAEYWADGSGTVTPPGHWNLIAQFVSHRDHHSLNEDVKMFFGLNNALFDASIAVWHVKNFYESVRPISAIRFLFRGKQIKAWAGPGLGTQMIAGETWQPYLPTPPFPEYVSGHSTFSSAAAQFLQLFTNSNRYGQSVIIPKGSSLIEPGLTPPTDVTLSWETFTEAAEQAGLSRRLGGIHFKDGDLQGREMGKKIGRLVFERANYFINGASE